MQLLPMVGATFSAVPSTRNISGRGVSPWRVPWVVVHTIVLPTSTGPTLQIGPFLLRSSVAYAAVAHGWGNLQCCPEHEEHQWSWSFTLASAVGCSAYYCVANQHWTDSPDWAIPAPVERRLCSCCPWLGQPSVLSRARGTSVVVEFHLGECRGL